MNRRVRVAVLAAGQATRFGRQKLLETWRGKPLLAHSMAAAQSVFPGRVDVVHDGDPGVIALAVHYDCRPVVNPRAAQGMGTSIAAAAAACDEEKALLIALGDQPQLTAAHLRSLVEAWDLNERSIVVSRYADTLGPPVLFGRAYRIELAALAGEQGARSIIDAHQERLTVIDVGSAFADIDTPADLEILDQASSDALKND
jgi:molybdenum cofactor cytidylyltransferase